MHAAVSAKGGKALVLSLDYDAHYCREFKARGSEWLIEIPGLARNAEVKIDGTLQSVPFKDVGSVSIPPGVGRHTVEVRLSN
jgi:hypothetical protein